MSRKTKFIQIIAKLSYKNFCLALIFIFCQSIRSYALEPIDGVDVRDIKEPTVTIMTPYPELISQSDLDEHILIKIRISAEVSYYNPSTMKEPYKFEFSGQTLTKTQFSSPDEIKSYGEPYRDGIYLYLPRTQANFDRLFEVFKQDGHSIDERNLALVISGTPTRTNILRIGRDWNPFFSFPNATPPTDEEVRDSPEWATKDMVEYDGKYPWPFIKFDSSSIVTVVNYTTIGKQTPPSCSETLR